MLVIQMVKSKNHVGLRSRRPTLFFPLTSQQGRTPTSIWAGAYSLAPGAWPGLRSFCLLDVRGGISCHRHPETWVARAPTHTLSAVALLGDRKNESFFSRIFGARSPCCTPLSGKSPLHLKHPQTKTTQSTTQRHQPTLLRRTRHSPKHLYDFSSART